MFKLFTNKKHSYKHNEQINSQNIDNSECFGVRFVKIYPEKIWFWLIIKGFFFTYGNTFGHILYKIFMKNVHFLRKSTACK